MVNKDMEKTLTISIAAYNVDQYLQDLLDQLLSINKTDKVEVLVIDDGSSDQTFEIAKEYAQKHPTYIKAIHKDNGGWGSTVTTGIQIATGKYFKLLDGDDHYDINALNDMIDFLEFCQADAVLSPYLKFFDGCDKTEIPDNPLFHVSVPKSIDLKEIPIKPFAFEMYSLVFRTRLLQKAKICITEHCFYTDNEYVLKGLCQCRSFSVVPYCVYQYRVGRAGQSVSIEGMNKHYQEFEYVLRKMLVFTRDEVKNELLQTIFFERYKGLSYYYFETLFVLGNEPKHQDSCKRYDLWLKKHFPTVYHGICYIPLMFLRCTRYRLYKIALLLSKIL